MKAHPERWEHFVELRKAHSEWTQVGIDATDRFRKSPEGKAFYAEKARERNASGSLGRKTAITDAEKQAASERMKGNNPVNRPEVRERIRQTVLAQRAQISERTRAMWADGRLKGRPITDANRKATSERMKASNPMKRPDVIAKNAESNRMRYQADPSASRDWIRRGVGPTKAEMALLEIVTPLGFRFVGDGQLWIGPCQSGCCRNPDFIHGDGRQKIALLLNGKPHSQRQRNTEEEMADYAEQGWQVLIIRSKELSDPPAIHIKTANWLAGLA